MNDDIRVVSGIGQYHTDRKTPYLAITLPEVREMVDCPPSVEKPRSQWLIPSVLPSRSFAEQERNGEFHLIWCDIDDSPPPLDRLAEAVTEAIGFCDFEAYCTRSATADNPKSRVLMPLERPLRGADWIAAQTVLSDSLARHGITGDPAAHRPAQLCYLPNRGVFYATRHRRTGKHFDPLKSWAVEINAIRAANRANRATLENERRVSAERRATMPSTGSLIGAFNAAFSVTDILLQAGYRQRGRTFCHPESASGTYSATVRNGRVHALSTADPLHSDGGGAHDAFSAFSVLFHGGNVRAALRDAQQQWLLRDGQPWSRTNDMEVAHG